MEGGYLQCVDNLNTKVGSYPDFKHTVTQEALCIDGFYNPSCVPEELNRRDLTPSQRTRTRTRTSTHTHIRLSAITIHDKSLPCIQEGTAFVAFLRACSKNKDLCQGIRLHHEILRKGLLEMCLDALITMYAKCGAVTKAEELLDAHGSSDAFSWTALIAGYVRHGRGQDALNCFEQMQHKGLSPDAVTFTCILKACGSINAVDKGEQIHVEIARQGLLGNDIVLGTALLDMYVKFRALAKAREVLEELPSRDVVSWSALIAGYAQQGQGVQALNCFEQMQQEGFSPDAATFTSLLKACGSIKAVDKGEQIHDEIARQGLLAKNIVLRTALIDMYAKCGALAKAQQVLEEIPSRSVVSWSALIAGYAQHGQGEQALGCFERMQCEGLSPDAVTFACVLKACGTIGDAKKGERVHDQIARQGLLVSNFVLGTALVDMYAKCRALSKARQVLEELPVRDVFSWSVLIAGYVQHGQGKQAFDCFERMQGEGLSPDAVTLACTLKACGSIGAYEKGEQIHREIVRQGGLGNDIVLGNALVDMYAKCSALAKARRVFEEVTPHDVASWNTLINGYVQQDQCQQALIFFEQMRGECISPDAVTFTCILKACGSIGAADKGEQVHDEIGRLGLLGSSIVIGNALVDMYAKCGALVKARRVLEELPSRDVISWNALIAGYAQQGQGEQALNCFEWMQHEGLFPNAVTFSCVLNVCRHLGLVEDGLTYFVNMSTKFGINPDVEHYACMVDLFGRAGHLDKAVKMMQEMPVFYCSTVWSALLGSCQKWGNVNVGRWAFEQGVQTDKSDPVAYVLMANIYAAAGMQEDAADIEAMRIDNKAWKKPVHS